MWKKTSKSKAIDAQLAKKKPSSLVVYYMLKHCDFSRFADFIKQSLLNKDKPND